MLRAATDSDAETIARWLSDPDITRYLTSNLRGGTLTPQVVKLALKRRDQGWFVFTDGAAGNQPAGLVAVDSIDAADGIGNLWFVLGDQATAGRGLTSAAIAAFCDANPLDLDVVAAWAAEPNKASQRCLEKAGFSETGRIQRAVSLPEGKVARVLFARQLARKS